MIARFAMLVLAFALAGAAFAQDKKRIEKAADLPRFSYKVDGKLDDIVRDDAKFKAFARELRRDTESVLAQYDIADKAMLRQQLGVIVRLDYFDGRHDEALKGLARIRELEEKPSDKLLSGLAMRSMIAAERKAGNRNTEAYRAEVSRLIDAELATMPYEVVQNEIKEGKASAEIVSEALALGYIREASAADRRQGRRAVVGSRARARQCEVPARRGASAQADAGRHLQPLSRRAQGRQARHLGGARHPARRGEIDAAGEHRDLGQRRRHDAVRGKAGQVRRRQARRDRVRQVCEPGRPATCSRFPQSFARRCRR